MAVPEDLEQHLDNLRRVDLKPIALKDNKYRRGERIRKLADQPPLITAVEFTPQDGLAVLCGTHHVDGGYVLGIDIDRGNFELPWKGRPPASVLYIEEGTAKGKWHMFLQCGDRLDGQINLKSKVGGIVVEVKGYGQALRSYPSLPPDKPKGYTPVCFRDTTAPETLLSCQQIIDSLLTWSMASLGEVVEQRDPIGRALAKKRATGGRGKRKKPSLHGFDIVALASRYTTLVPSGSDQLKGLCPIHDEKTPSFFITPKSQTWKCFGACQAGGDATDFYKALTTGGKL